MLAYIPYNNLNEEQFIYLESKLYSLAEKLGEMVREYKFRRSLDGRLSDLLVLTYFSKQNEKFRGGFGIWFDEKATSPVFNINVHKEVKIRNYYYRIWENIIEKKSIEELTNTVDKWLPKIIEYYNNITESELKERGSESSK